MLYETGPLGGRTPVDGCACLRVSARVNLREECKLGMKHTSAIVVNWGFKVLS